MSLATLACMTVRVSSARSKVEVDDVSFDRVTMREAVRSIVAMARKRDRPRYACTGNLDHLVIAERDPAFRAAYRAADLVVADGAPIVWLSWLASRAPLPERVAGSDLFWELARVSGEAGLRLFFLGGAPGSAASAADAVSMRYPSAHVVGTYCPPHASFATEAEQQRIRWIIRHAAPDILMVALGAPKQEKWIAANKDVLGVPVSIGVGGSFEMAAGVHRRAPHWVRRVGLEWLYRFAQEPGRLFQRYFVEDLPYFGGAAMRALARRVGVRGHLLPQAAEHAHATTNGSASHALVTTDTPGSRVPRRDA
jgi:N-acetylglucosaminyldiphosphoundecaprenol N-acetyl-beta-D-mannosaminyltransferase